ncbi:GGDEF domain-containing protein [Paucibacter soli]|uniref:GGDEF domain-containing protein n=1 Tax=Paucibacter soli TaxID=3133433 RepID=UPI00309FFC7A
MSLLASLQLLLYALLWTLAAVVHKGERPALLHWLGFSLVAAAQAALVAWRPDGPAWLTHTGSSLATILSLALAGRGVLVFLRQPPRNAFWLGMLAAALPALLWIGPADTPARVAAMSGFNAGLLIVAFWLARRAFVQEFGIRIALCATLPAAALLAMNLFYLAQGLRRLPMDIVGSNAISIGTWALTLVSAAAFNFLFIFLVTIRLLQSLRRQAGLDALTGLPNRRAMQERLQLEWERAQRYQTRFVAIATDIDHFKHINDRHGHGVGDQALRAVASTLLDHVRETDHLSRFGGEEFLVLMPQACAATDGLRLAERLRSAVAALRLSGADGSMIALSASFGVSESAPDDANSEQLLRRADQALYQAKYLGRDRVVLHEPGQVTPP